MIRDFFMRPFTRAIHHSERKIMAALDNLIREVQEQRTVTNSAIALLAGLKQKLDEIAENTGDAQIQALADDLERQQQDMAAAITLNTPVDETEVIDEGGETGTEGNPSGEPLGPDGVTPLRR